MMESDATDAKAPSAKISHTIPSTSGNSQLEILYYQNPTSDNQPHSPSTSAPNAWMK